MSRPAADALLIVAKTLYGEGRNQSPWAKMAILRTIMNRAARSWRGQTTLEGVCLDPHQYSCWSDAEWNRKNRSMMEAATLDQPDFLSCYGLAATALSIFNKAEPDWWPYAPSEAAVDHYITVTDFERHRRARDGHWCLSPKVLQYGAIGDHVFFTHE